MLILPLELISMSLPALNVALALAVAASSFTPSVEKDEVAL
jgi:hypothetical protein